MSTGINLLHPTNQENTIIPKKKASLLRLIAGSLLFLVSVSAVILFILVALSPLPELKKQEQSLRLALSESNTDMAKMALVDERLTAVGGILTKRKSFDQTLALVQSKLPANVVISAIRVDQGTMTLIVQSKSLQSLDTFLNGLMQSVQEKKGFSQVTLTDLTAQDTQNAFTVIVSLVML